MKHILQAVDDQIALNAFYHASDEPMPLGEELEARVDPWSDYVT